MKKLIFASILILMVFSVSPLYGQGSHILRQMIRVWPLTSNATGTQWYTYQLYDAERRILEEDSIGSFLTVGPTNVRWNVDVGNFNQAQPPTWTPGDTIVCFGSFDTAYAVSPGTYGNNKNHTGFYWLFSDTLTTVDPQTWTPDDTLRPMPKPRVYKTGPGGIANDTIWIKIPNPNETRRADQTQYDVMGFLLWADSGGVGTPNAYAAGDVMNFGFIPVQGDTADTTVFWTLESTRWLANSVWPTYFAYKIVARPDTVDSPTVVGGYTSYYLSMNSDSIHIYHNVVGIDEQISVPITMTGLRVFPNPAHGSFAVSFKSSGTGDGVLRMYDASGRETETLWQGTIDKGENTINLSYNVSGIFFLALQTNDSVVTKKIILK